jgi:hypothetical protein
LKRVFLRLEVLAVVIVAVCLTGLSAAQKPSRAAQIQLMAGPGDTLTLSNDKEGAAVLSLGGMRPGDSVTDTVTLGNTGTLPGQLSLATSNLVDTPGPGGGALSDTLDLRIRDVTVPASPTTVYDDKIAAVTPVDLGTVAAGDSRVYEFRVSFHDAGPGAENPYQGSAMSVQFDWSAVNSNSDTTPPETTITSGPAALVASRNATFTFAADEAGSTFKCSLDGAAFGPCASPTAYSGLADGPHTFAVRATDPSVNTDPTPDTAVWTIDATAPTVSLADPGSPLDGTVTLVPTADDGSGSGVADLIVQRSPAGAGTWTTIGTSWDTNGVSDGSYDLRARATDSAGNIGSSAVRTVIVDNGVPTQPQKFSGAQRNHRLVLSWKAAADGGGPVTAYLLYVNGALARTLGGSTLSADMGRFKTSDARSFQVAARDGAGNVGKKTRALVIVPSLSKLTVAQARSRLTSRGLKVGTVKHAYSATVQAGHVINARAGVVFKGSAVAMTVSRGPAPNSRTSQSDAGGGGTSGYQPGDGFGPTTSGGTVWGGGTSTPVTPQGGGDGAPATPETEPSKDGAGAAVPASFSPGDGASSPLRRILGLVLLAGAFLAACGAALRVRGPRGRQSVNAPEQLVFWDERLLHALGSAVRRVGGFRRH